MNKKESIIFGRMLGVLETVHSRKLFTQYMTKLELEAVQALIADAKEVQNAPTESQTILSS